MLLAVPNVSEGRDAAVLDAIGAAFAAGGARVLDRHADPDHHRAVFTLAGAPGTLHEALADGARAAIERIDITRDAGLHPHVGAIDVAPVVFRTPEQRGAAAAPRRSRSPTPSASWACPSSSTASWPTGARAPSCAAAARPGLAQRMADGPEARLRPRARCTRPRARCSSPRARRSSPSTSSWVRPATADDARRIAAPSARAASEGLPGLRAIGLTLAARGDVAQVSCNVEDHEALPLAALLEAVERHAPVTRGRARRPGAARRLRRAGPSACRSATGRASSSD